MNILKSESHEYENSCRLCRDHGVYQIDQHELFLNGYMLVISEALVSFTNENTLNDKLSSYLCESCTDELGKAYEFMIKVKNSEEQLEDIEIYNDTETEEQISSRYSFEDENYLEDEIIQAEEIIQEPEIIHEPTRQSIPSSENPRSLLDTVKISKKMSNIPLTKEVKSIVNRANQTDVVNTVVKRKHTSSNDNEKPSGKRQCTSLNNIMVPQLILNLEDITPDTDIQSEASKYLADVKTKKNKSPSISKKNLPSPEVKITIDMAATAIGKEDHNIIDVYSNLRTQEDTSILYQCTYCPKAYSTQYHLAIHNKRSHICQHCLIGFTKIEDLQKHVRTEHTSFICSFCNKKLSNNSNLRQHVKKLHGLQLPVGISLITYEAQLKDSETDENIVIEENVEEEFQLA